MVWDRASVIEIAGGREGLWGIRNRNLIPLGSLLQLRNATLGDHTWRKGGGASTVGSSAGASLTGKAAIDYFPSSGVQRTLAAWSDGTLQKDDGAGDSWTTLKSGLTTSGAVPFWALGGAESAGRNRKAFYCDRVNAVQVLSGDGASMAAISAPPTDWASANQPGFLVIHQGFLWGGGNANDPYRVYRSLATNHEDFTTTAYSLSIFPGEYERLVAGLSYKGLLLLWGYPEGCYAVDTSDPSSANWRVYKVARAGAAGPKNAIVVEDDILWVSPDGSFHLISATETLGSVRATDLAYRKLGAWVREQINLAQLASAEFEYYSHKLEVELACHAAGGTAKNRRLHMDLNRRDLGERWIWWDRDRNEAFFLRKKNEILVPAMLDNAGQLWELDRPNRNANGSAYTFEAFLKDTDFSELQPAWRGRKKNGRFIQVEYDPLGSATLVCEVIRDGDLKQTINFSLTGGPAALPVTLPVTLGADSFLTTDRKRLLGQATRWGFRFKGTGLNEDVSIARVLIGLEVAAT